MRSPADPDAQALRRAWLITLAFALLRVAITARVQLVPDEAYYWEWSRSLDWSYYDQGPMLALAIRLGTGLLGPNAWGVRLPAVLAGVGVSGFYIWLAAWMGKPRLAPWLVLAANTMLLTAVGAMLMMHDSLLGLWWCLGLALALKAGQGDGRWWLGAGLACGLGCLSKYTGLFLPVAFLAPLPGPSPVAPAPAGTLALPGRVPGRVPGGRPHPLLEPPARMAQLRPRGVAGRRGRVTAQPVQLPGVSRVPAGPGDAGAGRAGGRGPMAGAARLAQPGPGPGLCSPRPRPLPLAFSWHQLSLRTRVEGNWPAQAYLAAPAPGGPVAGAAPGAVGPDLALGPGLGRLLHPGGPAHSQAAFGWIPFPADRAARLDRSYLTQGWQELAGRVAQERAALGPGAFVGCRTYQNAAELAFYLPGQERPVILQKGTINHQYRFWNHPQDYAGRDAVLVVGQDWEVDEMRLMFKTVQELAPCDTGRQGVTLRRTRLYLGRGLSGRCRRPGTGLIPARLRR